MNMVNKILKYIKSKLTTKNIIVAAIIIGLIITLLQVDSCYNNKFKSQQGKYDSIALANQKYVQVINKQGEIITKQEVIIVTKQKDIKSLTLETFDLKKKDEKRIKQIDALLKIKTSTRVDSIEVAYVDLEERKRFSDSLEKTCEEVIAYYDSNYLKVPRVVKVDSVENKDFQFAGTIKKDKFVIDSVVFPNVQDIAIVETKGGLFRRDINGKVKFYTPRKLEIMVKNTNKFVNTKGMTSLVYQPKVGGRWLERLITFGAGVAATVLILK